MPQEASFTNFSLAFKHLVKQLKKTNNIFVVSTTNVNIHRCKFNFVCWSIIFILLFDKRKPEPLHLFHLLIFIVWAQKRCLSITRTKYFISFMSNYGIFIVVQVFEVPHLLSRLLVNFSQYSHSTFLFRPTLPQPHTDANRLGRIFGVYYFVVPFFEASIINHGPKLLIVYIIFNIYF